MGGLPNQGEMEWVCGLLVKVPVDRYRFAGDERTKFYSGSSLFYFIIKMRVMPSGWGMRDTESVPPSFININKTAFVLPCPVANNSHPRLGNSVL